MQINRSPWRIVLILFLCQIAECDEEKIKRAIYSYQSMVGKESNGKSQEFEKFQGSSPFEQVLAALGISGGKQANIHTTVEYWPPDMDREKFYHMNKGEYFPFVSWNSEQSQTSFQPSLPPSIQNEQEVKKAPQKIPEKVYDVQSFSLSYPAYVDPYQSSEVKEPEFKWIENKPKVKATKSEIKQKFTEDVTKNYDYYKPTAVDKIPVYENVDDIIEEIPYAEKYPKAVTPQIKESSFKIKEVFNKTPKVIEGYRPQVIEEIYPKITTKKPAKKLEAQNRRTTTTTTISPIISHPKFYIHTSKIIPPAHLPSPSIISSTEDSLVLTDGSSDDETSMTNAGPVVFPEITTLTSRGNNVQRGNNNGNVLLEHGEQKKQLLQQQQDQHHHQQPPLPPIQKRRKLKKKVKTSSIAHEVVDIGNRGSSGTHAPPPPPPSQFDVIVVTSTTITPKTSFSASSAVKVVDFAAAPTRKNILDDKIASNSYVDPNYSNMIDNLSKLTELSFNSNVNNSSAVVTDEGTTKKAKKVVTTTTALPITEIYQHHHNHKHHFIDERKSSPIQNENVMSVLSMMRNSSVNMSNTNVEELKKAVIDNDLPRVKKIVKQHMEKRPVVLATTTENSILASSSTRGKLSRSRYGSKTKVHDNSLTTTEKYSTTSFKPKIKRPSVSTVRQVISTTKSSRQINRIKSATATTTPRVPTSRSTRSIARRITTTRKSLRTTLSA